MRIESEQTSKAVGSQRRYRRVGVLLVLSALLASACGGGRFSRDSQAPANGDNLVDAQVAGVDATSIPLLPGESLVHIDPRYEVTVSTHTYGQGQSHTDWGSDVDRTVDLVLDLYEPVGAPPGRPALLVIHGGAFVLGSRESRRLADTISYFAERGWVVASVDYRLAGDHGTVPDEWFDAVTSSVPDQGQNLAMALYPAARDAKAAARWLHASAEEYQIDPSRVAALGASAGAYLAVMLGASAPDDFVGELSLDDDPTLASTNLDSSADVSVIIDNWGGPGHLKILETIDGESRFDEADAPILIVHGTDDRTVPFEEAQDLVSAYQETGAPFAFHPIEGGGHGIWDATVDGRTLSELSFDFMVEHLDLRVAQ